jgi:hypothetical protein
VKFVKKTTEQVEYEEIEIIHLAWMVGEDCCYYPPYWKIPAQLKKGILVGEAPNRATWTLHKIKVLHSYGKS